MVKLFEVADNEDLVESLFQAVEQEQQKKIFVAKVLEEKEPQPKQIPILIVFEDKSVLYGAIKVETIDGKLACRIQANYI